MTVGKRGGGCDWEREGGGGGGGVTGEERGVTHCN